MVRGLPKRLVPDANDPLVFVGELLEGARSTVVPHMVRVDFVADDPAPDASVRGFFARIAICEEFASSAEPVSCVLGLNVARGYRVTAILLGCRMDHQGINSRVACGHREDNQIDDESGIGERLDLAVDIRQISVREIVSSAIAFPFRCIGLLLLGKHCIEGKVDRTVTDTEFDRIIDHLDLETFDRFGFRESLCILSMSRAGKQEEQSKMEAGR